MPIVRRNPRRVCARESGSSGRHALPVHANDVPGRERESLEVTQKYEAVAPRNPHALHMPTHIYTRLGDWDGVIRGNLRAAEAALEHPAGENGELVWDEFPHAIEYLVYAYLQQGDDDARPRPAAAAARDGTTWSRHSRLRSTWHRQKRAMRWSDATGRKPPRSCRASPRRSTGTDSRGPRPSRISRTGSAPRI